MSLFLCAILALAPFVTEALYEDQAGTFDWYKAQVGPITSVHLGSKPRVFIGTSENVIGSLNLRDGSIAWRKLIDGPLVGDALIDDTSLFISYAGGKIRAFDQTEGGMRWEQPSPDLTSISVGAFHDVTQVAAATPKRLRVSSIPPSCTDILLPCNHGGLPVGL